MLRKPSFGEMCLQTLIVALMLPWLVDLYRASQAPACVQGAVSPECYPWGPTGSGAESWRYLSQELYLVHLTILIQFFMIGVILPYFTLAPSTYIAGLAILVWIFCDWHADLLNAKTPEAFASGVFKSANLCQFTNSDYRHTGGSCAGRTGCRCGRTCASSGSIRDGANGDGTCQP